MKKSLVRRVQVAVVGLAAASTAFALISPVRAATPASPAVDRGLPIADLNNGAGSNRSNVAWSNGNDAITGDTFVVGSAGQNWIVTGIRTWNIGHIGKTFGDEFSADTLYFGTHGVAPVATGTVAVGSNTDSNPNITHRLVTYVGGTSYQAQDDTFRQMWQNDFTNLNLTVDGGTTYYFAVDGITSYYWFNHASNAALSGSPQQGADNKYVSWSKADLNTPQVCDSNGPISGFCNGGWDKSSDINVQVFASQVATAKSACKDGGWHSLVRTDGTAFKNQGDCVSYANTGK
jgi:hypothetical protein